jgi:hypothetical protein
MEEDVTSLARRWMFVRLNERFPFFLPFFYWFLIEEKAPFHATTRPTSNDRWLIQQLLPLRPPVLRQLVK